MEENINTVLSAGNLKHTLHLYTSGVNKYAIQSAFLAMAKKGEKVIYVTNENPESVREEFKGLNIELSIISPDELNNLKVKGKLRIIIDAGSIEKNHIKREEHLDRICNINSILSPHTILCTYLVSKINPKIIKELATHHDKLIFTTGDTTVLSSESFDKLNIADESIERFVKNDLEMIVLALITKKPMCGTEIIKTIHKNFNVLLSPGTIYPLLHTLEKNGLLKCEYGIKKKVYKAVEGAKTEIKSKLNERVQVSKVLSRFLQSGGVSEK